MSKAIHVILIDDLKKDDTFIQSFTDRARDFGMKITHFKYGKTGIKELEKHPYKYKALILDARCIWDESQQFPDERFLTRAVAELERLENTLYKTYPLVVNTGYIGRFKQEREFILKRQGEIFEKSTDDEKKSGLIFEFLKDKIENSEEWKYQDVLEAAEIHLPSRPKDFRAGLLKVLKEFENPANNESVLREARVIQEEIYKSLREKGCFSEGFNTENSPPSFVDKNKHLSGNERYYEPTTTVYQTPALSYLALSVFKTCSSFGNHLTSKPTNVDVEYWELPSNYAVKSVVYALLEQLIWFKKLMDK